MPSAETLRRMYMTSAVERWHFWKQWRIVSRQVGKRRKAEEREQRRLHRIYRGK